MIPKQDKKRLLILIVTYNAEKTLAKVLNRIPEAVFNDPRFQTEILIIDDGSADRTFEHGLHLQELFSACPLTILKNPVNLGYGGNQKVGYRYALDHKFDVVALLHGDGQYAPEKLPELVEPFLSSSPAPAAVFGSRMQPRSEALKGGMPKYKFVGNIILSFLQNKMAGMQLSEWHSGYRLYSCSFLASVPFEKNSNGFDFDTDIILQLKATQGIVQEFPIPTYYGDEISHVNGIPYGYTILVTTLCFSLQRLGLFYEPKFDLEVDNTHYQAKFDFESSHSIALSKVTQQDFCLLLGSGPAPLAQPFADRSRAISTVDMHSSAELKNLSKQCWQVDLDHFDFDCSTKGERFTKVIALDIIEHLKSPETFCQNIRNADSCRDTEVIITTPNIAFLPIRLMLLLGFFNYGKRGILDRTHTRLFTFGSLRRLLMQAGFDILEMRAVPAPFPLALGNTALARSLLAFNILVGRILPSVFGFQIFVRAKPRPTVKQLLEDAKQHSLS